MRIKKYIAESIREGKARIIKQMGEDAIVLSTRTVTNPNNSEKNLVEIVAAIDNLPIKSTAPKLPISRETSSPEKNQIDSLTQARHIYDEIDSMKAILQKIADSVKYKNSSILSPIYDNIYKALIDADFSEKFALSIAGDLSSDEKVITMENAVKKARYLVSKNIKTEHPLEKGKSCKTVLFFGPTGCGKTLTLIKLAIVSKLVMESNTLIISADMHKVGGAEQLETFSSIAGISFRAVYSSEELQQLIKRESYRDMIMIDTTGRSQKNNTGLKEIKDITDSIIINTKFLVQSATTSKSTFESVIDNYAELNPDTLILTKMDEAETLGYIIETIQNKNLSIGYFTNGQQIPDDIEPANKEYINNLILPDSLIAQ